MPKTPLQMLLRGQNLLGYRHYADDVVERFVERAVKNGMDVFRVFDAMNDPRNMQAALQAVRRHGAHAQGTLVHHQPGPHPADLARPHRTAAGDRRRLRRHQGHVRHSDAACRL
jgi:pyruvate/oxaloacetate carboxyltransferase